MITSRVESVAVVLTLLGAACAAAESKGDVDFQERTGGRPSSETGGRGSEAFGGTNAGGSATGGDSAAACPAAQPNQGSPCQSVGMVCEYGGTTCTCSGQRPRGWNCGG